jgi:hypothetical protein
MILHERRKRPEEWASRRERIKPRWITPLIAVEWVFEWVAYLLSHWSLLEVLEYLGSFSVLIAVVFYFSESGDRVKQRHYQAWQVINTAQGKGGSGGRIEALQELNEDKVPLVGVDVSSAFLQGLNLSGANLSRADFDSADLRNSRMSGVDFMLADLNSANLREADLSHVRFVDADLRNADLTGSMMAGANLSGARLEDADLSSADLNGIEWQQIKSVKGANLTGVKNAPTGFMEWALKNGAVVNTGSAK